MEVARPPSNSALFPRSPRRSFPNLQHLSLAPLSSRFPIDDEDGDESGDHTTPRSSYIAAKTAPTTPSILSRSNSRTRKPRKQAHYAHDSYFPSLDHRHVGDVPKAKSTSTLLGQPPASHSRSKSASVSIPAAPPSRRTLHNDSNDEWLHRAGLVIASEMRESKGQSWLVSRQSSTSLVHDHSDGEEVPEPRSAISARSAGGFSALADDEFSPITPRNGRLGSRPQSRAASARNSRRGSRVGSRVELITPMGVRTPGIVPSSEIEGYFDSALAAEPDFVEPEEDEQGRENEAEVARLTSESRSGLGGLVDRLAAWSLFSVQEDGDETEDEGEAGQHADRQAETLRRKRTEEERAAVTPAVEKDRNVAAAPDGGDGQGAWQDAAWLLSVASKVIL